MQAREVFTTILRARKTWRRKPWNWLSMSVFNAIFGDSGPVVERIERFLLESRDALKGCRIGRMVWDSAIGEDELRRPIQKYFRYIESRMVSAIEQALASGEIQAIIPPEHIAAVVLAAIQGALTMGRAMQDPNWYARTIQATVSFINRVIKVDR